MGAIAFQITSLAIVYSTVYSGADQRKHESSAALAFVRGIHRGPVNSSHKWPVTRKMFPFDDVIMIFSRLLWSNWFSRVSVQHSWQPKMLTIGTCSLPSNVLYRLLWLISSLINKCKPCKYLFHSVSGRQCSYPKYCWQRDVNVHIYVLRIYMYVCQPC